MPYEEFRGRSSETEIGRGLSSNLPESTQFLRVTANTSSISEAIWGRIWLIRDFGSYELKDKLGEGSYGSVWSALHSSNQTDASGKYCSRSP